MKQYIFEQQHEKFWHDFEEVVTSFEKNKPSINAQEFARQYRIVCQHVAQASSRNYSPSLIEDLQHLIERAHHVLYRHSTPILSQFVQWLRYDLPANVRAEKKMVIWAHLLFYVPFFVMMLFCAIFPDLAERLLGSWHTSMMDRMYEDMAERTRDGENRDFGINMLMFGYYIFNNVGIAFKTAGSGFLFGVGTLYILLFNGFMIGSVFGHMLHNDIEVAAAFFGFVSTHGAFELTGIVLSGAAGLRIGLALIDPQGYSRTDALRIQGRSAAKLITAAFFLLVIAAFFEAFWSSMGMIPPVVKIFVATFCWIGVYVYLFRVGKKK
ncbi:MAG: stage II sporulation protein M [Neisseriaceae bacterium]|nr:stage II sporulation protein M [Neisseriaceae bacterium]